MVKLRKSYSFPQEEALELSLRGKNNQTRVIRASNVASDLQYCILRPEQHID